MQFLKRSPQLSTITNMQPSHTRGRPTWFTINLPEKSNKIQSMSVWSLGRYLMLLSSNLTSISSGNLPITRTAYIPRTYFAAEVKSKSFQYKVNRKQTCSLPPPNPTLIRVNYSNNSVELSSCTSRNVLGLIL